MTLGAIASNIDQFVAAVVYTAPDATAPVVTNSSGKTLKYQGDGVAAGTFTPVAGQTYRMSFLFDGINVNVYTKGVA